jgi:hypothetical protein
VIPVQIYGDVYVHNVTIFERPTGCKMSQVAILYVVHELIGDPVNYDIVHAGTARFGKARISERRWIG